MSRPLSTVKGLTHRDLITLATLLGYAELDKGLCRGFSAIWMLMLFAHNERGLFAFLQFIEAYRYDFYLLKEEIRQTQFELRDLRIHIEILKKTPGSSAQISELKAKQQAILSDPKKQMLLEIPALFENMNLYLHPEKHSDLFAQYLRQENITSIFPLTQPTQTPIENFSLLFQKTHIFDAPELYRYLDGLSQILAQTDADIPILLSSGIHSVCFRYDKIKKTWLYIDTNNLLYDDSDPLNPIYGKRLSTNGLVSAIFDSFEDDKKGHTLFGMEFFSTQSDAEKIQLHSALHDLEKKHPISSKHIPAKNARGYDLIGLACKKGDVETVRDLLSQGVDINNSSTILLRTAIIGNHLALLTLLLEHTTDIEKKDSEGSSALAIALAFNRIDAARKIVFHIEQRFSARTAITQTKINESPDNLLRTKMVEATRKRHLSHYEQTPQQAALETPERHTLEFMQEQYPLLCAIFDAISEPQNKRELYNALQFIIDDAVFNRDEKNRKLLNTLLNTVATAYSLETMVEAMHVIEMQLSSTFFPKEIAETKKQLQWLVLFLQPLIPLDPPTQSLALPQRYTYLTLTEYLSGFDSAIDDLTALKELSMTLSDPGQRYVLENLFRELTRIEKGAATNSLRYVAHSDQEQIGSYYAQQDTVFDWRRATAYVLDCAYHNSKTLQQASLMGSLTDTQTPMQQHIISLMHKLDPTLHTELAAKSSHSVRLGKS